MQKNQEQSESPSAGAKPRLLCTNDQGLAEPFTKYPSLARLFNGPQCTGCIEALIADLQDELKARREV